MQRTHTVDGKLTSFGAKVYGFKKNNKLGKKFGKRERHWNWNGGYKYFKSGSKNIVYRRIKINGKYVAEHRYIMEEKLGRKLDVREIVHHIDGNGLNNDISNLQLMKWGEHTHLHKGGGF